MNITEEPAGGGEKESEPINQEAADQDENIAEEGKADSKDNTSEGEQTDSEEEKESCYFFKKCIEI